MTLNANTYTITGTAAAGSLVRIWVDANHNGVKDAGEALTGTQQLASGVTSYSLSVNLTQGTQQANAANYFVVTATDAANNESAGVSVPTITEDSAAPAAPAITSPAGAMVTNEISTTILGTAEANALVEVWNDLNNNGVIDGTETAAGMQQLSAGATNFLITVGLTPSATNNFKAIAVDAAGNVSPAAVLPSITQDSSTPSAPTVTNPSGTVSVNRTTQAITGTAAAGTLVKVWVDSNDDGVVDTGDTVAGSQQLASTATSYSISVPLTSNAVNSFLATATNTSNNNQSAAADVPDITQDSIAPAAPSQLTLDAGSDTGTSSTDRITADNTLSFSGIAEAGSTVTIFSDGVAVGSDGVDDLGNWSIITSILPDGAHSITARATDDAGNTGAASASLSIVIDTTPPSLSLPGDQTDEATGASGAVVNYPAATATDTVTANPTLTYSQASGTLFPLGTAPVTVTATDVAGNSSSGVFNVNVRDTTPPDTTITSNPPSFSASTSASFSFAGTDTVTAAGNLAFVASLDASPFVAATSPISYTGLTQGSHTFHVKAIDQAGNLDPSPATFSWMIDTSAPTLSGVPATLAPFSPNGDGVQDISPPIAYSVSEAVSVTVRITVGSTVVRTLISGASQGAGVYGVTWDGKDDNGATVTDGTYTYTVTAINAFGISVSQSGTVAVDTVPPVAVIDGGPSTPSSSSGATFTFHSTEAGGTFQYSLDSGAFVGPVSNGSIVLSNLADGPHTFTIRATDAAGNTSPATASYNWTVNTQGLATTLTVVTPATATYGGTITLQASLTGGGTGLGGKAVGFTRNGVAVGTAVTDSSGMATLNNVSLAGINAGSYIAYVGAGFLGDAAYAGSSGSGPLTVNRADQAISFGVLGNQIYGAPTFSIVASASSGLGLTFHIDAGPATIVGNVVTITGAGTVSVRASQAGDANFNAAADVVQSFTVTPAVLTVTADAQARLYGDANPALSASFSGFVNGDTAGVVTGSASLSTAATAASVVGSYAITATAGSLAAANYSFRFAVGTLTITQAHLMVTIDDQSKVYGDAIPTLTATLTGFKNGDTASVVSGAAALSTAATASSAVGSYAITASAGSLAAANYDFRFTAGTLTVTNATLRVTADDQSRLYGDANPALSASFSGFVNGETASVVSGAPTLTTSATASSAVGSYAITASAGSLAAANYSFSFVAGTLTVTPATLTVTADDHSKVYGDANPALSASFSGFKNGETLATRGVTGAPALSTGVTATSAVGSYTITASAGTLTAANYDYSFNFATGTLTVTKADADGHCRRPVEGLRRRQSGADGDIQRLRQRRHGRRRHRRPGPEHRRHRDQPGRQPMGSPRRPAASPRPTTAFASPPAP